MNPIIAFITAFAIVATFLITRAIERKKAKKELRWNLQDRNEIIGRKTTAVEEMQKIINEKNEALTRANREFDELKRQHQEVQSKCKELQKVDQDAETIEKENEEAFEGLKKLLEEAEATNEILLKCVAGEITREEALEQIQALAPEDPTPISEPEVQQDPA
jgi:hypothetical protein